MFVCVCEMHAVWITGKGYSLVSDEWNLRTRALALEIAIRPNRSFFFRVETYIVFYGEELRTARQTPIVDDPAL